MKEKLINVIELMAKSFSHCVCEVIHGMVKLMDRKQVCASRMLPTITLVQACVFVQTVSTPDFGNAGERTASMRARDKAEILVVKVKECEKEASNVSHEPAT